MPGLSIVVLTRREKRIGCREAVIEALRRLGGVVSTWEEEQQILALIVEKINTDGLADFPVDERDVILALGWLHKFEYVVVSHRDPETWERRHRIELS